jgi:glycosyltransferase involved in cell wall biosynthesis
MKAIYLASLSSKRVIEKISANTGLNPGYAVQKFSNLIVKGLIKNGVDTMALTSIPVNRRFSKKIFWRLSNETEEGIYYHYIPFINVPYIRHICLVVYTFFYVLLWGSTNRKDKFILMDVLNVSICTAAVLACKLNRLHCIGVVTDMPGLIVGASGANSKNKYSLASKVSYRYLHSFDSYVLLTQQMNSIINKKNRPYIVMEGLCDSNIQQNNENYCDINVKSILYAGGLHERYGLKMLTDAFMSLLDINYRLIIYGSGPFVEELKKDMKKDSRIEYRGVAPNEEVMKAEYAASVLVNPRPTKEDFTKYSFPSKNIEYMSTGRPLLTTKLPGMPEEYYPYVYMFETESLDGYRKTLKEVLEKDYDELAQKGREAQSWVLKNKNNVVQTRRIIELYKSSSC